MVETVAHGLKDYLAFAAQPSAYGPAAVIGVVVLVIKLDPDCFTRLRR